MSRKPQKCSMCKKQGHNSRNCPCPIDPLTFDQPCVIIDVEGIINKNRIEQEKYTEDDYGDKRDQMVLIEKELLKKLVKDGLRKQGEKYVFENVKKTVTEIIKNKLNGKLATLIIAEPGSGKTMVIDGSAYVLKTHAEPLMGDRITVMTGMSDTLCRDSLNESLPFVREEFLKQRESDKYRECVYHNPTVPKRFAELKKNQHLLYEQWIFIDECHIAKNIGNTIDIQLKLLGITREVAKKLKIHFVLISATPDSILKEYLAAVDDDCGVVFMEPGENYRGFKFFRENILDYKNYNLDTKSKRELLISMIKEKYTDPMYHFIRVKPGKFDKKLQLELREEGWKVKEYNMLTKYDFDLDAEIKNKPDTHTFFFIKDMLRASKRLRLNEFIGIIVEPCNKMNVTITAQGLIPRWWGYYTPLELSKIKTQFICDFSAVKEYLEFIENRGLVCCKGTKKANPSHQTNILERDPAKNEHNESVISGVSDISGISGMCRVYDDLQTLIQVCAILKYRYVRAKINQQGFTITSLNKKGDCALLTEAVSKIKSGFGGGGGLRTFYPCYTDLNDKDTLRFVLIIRKGDIEKVKRDVDPFYRSIDV